MVVFLSVIYLTLCAWTVTAQEISGPLMVIKESTFDFKKVKEGEIVEHTFTVLNKGNQNLEIEKIRTNCGCTKASYERIIPPDSEGKIVLKVDTEGFNGSIDEGAKIYTNDPKHKIVRIHIVGFVEVPISVTPGAVYFGGLVGSTIEKVVTIRAQEPEPLSIRPMNFTLPDKVDYGIETVEEGRCFRITFRNKSVIKERYGGALELQTNYPDKPVITIRVIGNIRTKD